MSDNLQKSNARITILIPIRDKYDYRLVNCLNSIVGQKLSEDIVVETLLVDYGSKKENKEKFDELVRKYNLKGIWTGVSGQWNKSHCLNIGIKRSTARYIQVCDTDIIFAPDYIETFFREAVQSPGQMQYCKMMDTPEGQVTGEIQYPDEYRRVLASTVYRGDRLGDVGNEWPFGSSILWAPRSVLVEIGGYDEQYKLWGDEDWDVVKRLLAAGLPLKDLSDRTSHVHQWHLRFENVGKVEGFEEQVAQNRVYFMSQKSIVRNPDGWGKM